MIKSGINTGSHNSLNPLKRVNSILTLPRIDVNHSYVPRPSQFPQTGQFNSYTLMVFPSRPKPKPCLNPLKRVNSILTVTFSSDCGAKGWKGKKDSDGKKVVEGVGGIFFDLI